MVETAVDVVEQLLLFRIGKSGAAGKKIFEDLIVDLRIFEMPDPGMDDRKTRIFSQKKPIGEFSPSQGFVRWMKFKSELLLLL